MDALLMAVFWILEQHANKLLLSSSAATISLTPGTQNR